MLSIDYEGDSTLTVQAARTGLATVQLDALVSDDDALLSARALSGTLSWGDGQTDTFTADGGTLSVEGAHEYRVPGRYFVTLDAANYRYPQPDAAQLRVAVVIVPAVALPAPPPPVVVGPILPRDQGYPNAQQWNFNISQDERILESSLKMLLTTDQGERLMRPSYGTDLRRHLFDQNVDDLENVVSESIRNAVSANEPRVTIESVTVRREPNTRNVYVDLVFGSKFNRRRFPMALFFPAPAA